MRLLLHDYPGHAFPLVLSRALARRGHQVLHLQAHDYPGPRGDFTRRGDDPPGLQVEGVPLGRLRKYDWVSRVRAEYTYGRRLLARAEAWRPDLILAGNGSLDVQRGLYAASRRLRVPLVSWVQDLHGQAIRRLLPSRLPLLGHGVGWYYERLEARMLRHAKAVIAIAEDFLPALAALGVAERRCHVIPNWAALDELPTLPRDNDWAREHGLTDRFVFLYAGTLGLKHDPAPLLALAAAFRDDPQVSVLVASGGPAVERLAAQAAARGLTGLRTLPFQPQRRFAQVLGAADALLAVLDPQAASFSVPSKVLSYMCAGRPVLAALPADNAAARLLRQTGAGRVVPPDDLDGLVQAARALRHDADLRRRMGAAGRAHAEREFDPDALAERFLKVIAGMA